VRVLYWSETFYPQIGGASIASTQLALALHRRGHELLVVTQQTEPSWPAEETYGGLPIRRLPFGEEYRSNNIHHLIRLRRKTAELQKAFKPDLVHLACGTTVFYFFLETRHVSPAPFLVTLHRMWDPRFLVKDTLLGHVLGAANAIVCLSDMLEAHLCRHKPEVRDRCHVIPNFVTCPDEPPPMPGSDSPTLLCLGRLQEEKGYDLALRAFARIVDAFPEARLQIVGDGPQRRALENLVHTLGLSDQVYFLGWTEPARIATLIRRAALVLMPSRTEALPMVALEAAAAARPVVATWAGGTPAVVLDGETGRLVEPENPEALSEAAMELLRSPALAGKMGRRAWSRAREKFSPEHCLERYDSLYRSTLEEERLHVSSE